MNDTLVVIELDGPLPSARTLAFAGARAAAAAVGLGEREFTAALSELDTLRALGLGARVRALDASTFYARRLASVRRFRGVGGGHLDEGSRGSMGGYPTLAEAEATLERLQREHPRVVRIVTFGASVERRPLHALCLTADAAADCAPPASGGGAWGRTGAQGVGPLPATLFTALTHPREPVTLVGLLDYVEQLLADHAAGDAAVAALLGSRRLWFAMVVNPDGYEHNRRMRPAGGGTKRKNGRPNRACHSLSDQGVDINRNWGYRFGRDDAGSSPSACAEDYRGSAAFSEPEAAALAKLMREQQVGFVLNLHGWGNSITHPFSYSALDTIRKKTPLSREQLLLFRRWGHDMCAHNGFVYGRAWETVGYEANGLPDDWTQGVLGVPAMTVELGSARDGFWPPLSRVPIISRQLHGVLAYSSRVSGSYLRPQLLHVQAGQALKNGGTMKNGGTVLSVQLTVDNVGMRSAGRASAVRIRLAAGGGTSFQNVRALPAERQRQAGGRPPVACKWSVGERDGAGAGTNTTHKNQRLVFVRTNIKHRIVTAVVVVL
ncbi:hypothetical protein T492DRAFT_72989 [Pavlovales sp. CCMP2436]|nr:hypothetical protein T492DRAFT_72989 [Pavlovales sp. CCMP2436]